MGQRFYSSIAVGLLWGLATSAGVPFQTNLDGAHVPRVHYLGCLWNFRTAITLCPSGRDNAWQKGNRYANITSRKALNSLEDQLLTGVQCFQSWILAHDLQEKFLSFYTGTPRQTRTPPVEEVLWITSLTEPEQQEILEVCPGMFITSLFLHSELRFSLNPNDFVGRHYRERALHILREMKAENGTFEQDHYRVTMQTWPLSTANAQSLQVRRTSARAVSADMTHVDLVIVACKSDLTWVDTLPLTDNMRIFIYAKCREAAESPLCQRSECISASHLDESSNNSMEGGVQTDECGGYLYHILRQYYHLAEWTIFLQDDAPRHLHLGYLNLVLKMITAGTLSALAPRLFLHLNNDRHLMYWTPCLATLTELLELPSSRLFASYCCSQFLVHKNRIQERDVHFFHTAQELLTRRLGSLKGCSHVGPAPPVASVGQRSSQVRLCHLFAS